ncbi:hypothetical protein BT93_L4519 [Corymbia citriodora subsp. variegata]|uniref:Scavenger mRNA decapping enzyme n=1 Tax=Corymbia citriodora subsp. variegata TaxID=360336 RepID=A0A8T0CHV9_CORYI|nr:hypothetical protein BT93_L4519 [Corymbia citriodora subsp. variegata]
MSNHSSTDTANLKVNLIWPCTENHVRKYTAQQLRYVTETPELYSKHIRPYIAQTQRTPKRLDWIYNILDGRTEQEDIVYRSKSFGHGEEGFVLLPDLNWDRRTATGIHLLALVERRDIWSIRDLKKKHVPWLKHVCAEIVKAAAEVGTGLHQGSSEDADADQFKCYLHYHPTYYHFHIHVVHVMLEAEGGTQSVGKAFSLENVISQLEGMAGDAETGMDSVALSFYLGEQSELWRKCFAKIKTGQPVELLEVS